MPMTVISVDERDVGRYMMIVGFLMVLIWIFLQFLHVAGAIVMVVGFLIWLFGGEK